MDIKDEKKLIEKAKKDPEVFGMLFEEYYPKILSYVLKRTGSMQIAQDLTSEIFLKALKNLWQFQWRNIPFSAWLYKITHHEICRFFRKNDLNLVSLDPLLEKEILKLTDDIDPHKHSLNAEESQEEKENILLIQKKLLKIPFKYQEVLTLRFFEEKTIKEICIILNKKKGTITSLLVRGLSLLKKEIHQEKLLQSFSESNINKNEKILSNIVNENL